MKTKSLLLGIALPLCLGLLSPMASAQNLYESPPDGYDGGSDWAPEDDPRETEWNHDNGSDQWEGELGIDGGMPGGVELLEQDAVEFIRIQDARTSGGTGDNRKIVFTKTVFEEGADPLAEGEAGVTLHFKMRLS
ncbi:MAG: hypothetical protein AAF514_16720, partial [Verrucomicrobiota bacterium]